MHLSAASFPKTLHSGSRPIFSACRFWIRAKAYVAEWQQRAGPRRDLMALDDRALWDLHLTRLDAANEAAKPFWKR